MKKPLIIEIPALEPFETYFWYFIKYGFGNKSIPNEFKVRGHKFFNHYLDQHDSKLNLRFKGLLPDQFIEELVRLTFSFQFFAEVRMNATIEFNNLGIISRHPEFEKIKNRLPVNNVELVTEHYTEHDKDLQKLKDISPTIRGIFDDFKKNESSVQEIAVTIKLNSGSKDKGRRKEEIVVPKRMWNELLGTLAYSSFNTKFRLDAFKNISNRGKNKGRSIIIQMLRGAMISYLRDRLIMKGHRTPPEILKNALAEGQFGPKITNEEAVIVGLVLVAAGFLKNEDDYDKEPDYKEKALDDKLSYYQHLYTEVKKPKLLRKDTPSATFDEDEETLYDIIPFMFDKV